MVQNEIRKKARIYGIIGVLSAIVLVAMIYSYGAAPQSLSLGPSPEPSNSPSDTLPIFNNSEAAPMQAFASYSDLVNFLVNRGNNSRNPEIPTPLPSTAPSSDLTVDGNGFSTQESSKIEGTYSITNIQVAGVDEADDVKTDGIYLYVIANNTVYILNSGATNPQNAQVLAKISYENKYISGIYLSLSGSKLAVLGNTYIYRTFAGEGNDASLIYAPSYGSSTTFVEVYDVSNKANPVLSRNFTMSGNYFNSRMIGNYIYAIVTESVYIGANGTVNLPIVFGENGFSNTNPTSIFYVPTPYSYYTYTSVISLNIVDNTQTPSNITVMMSGTSDMYVSANNIYVIAPTYEQTRYGSSIYRIGINQATLTLESKGSVPGYTINQYAMDEYNGNFRIATTMWFEDNATTRDGAVFKVSRQLNSIYVLNKNLNIVGKLEGFKMDESLYSVRFMGAKCYVVTFKQVDPFFVIDMSYPAAPRVAGELKIPGYSSYLYPIDENHIIGLGKENSTLKLSLFDVTNVNVPSETAKYIVDASYSDSTALYDPHAFLFDAQRQLLGIPVSINNIQIMPFISGDKQIGSATTNGNWQGVYIFTVDATSGFALKGNVTQIDSTQTQNSDYYWTMSNLNIDRSLYIGNTLYTFSNSRVQLNSLDNFSLLAKIDLN